MVAVPAAQFKPRRFFWALSRSRSHSGHIRGSHLRSSKVYSKTVPNKHKSNYANGVKKDAKRRAGFNSGGGERFFLVNGRTRKDSHGKIARNEEAKEKFMKQTGYPNGRPGYVVDHIVPLKRGGTDTPGNMQWQTKDAAKAKDKIE